MNKPIKLLDDFEPQRNNPGALLNKDFDKLHAYKQARKNYFETQQKIEEINTIKEEVNLIRSEMADLKSLLIKALENK